MPEPFVLVLDGTELVRSRESAALFGVLTDHVPDGSVLALGGRVDPPLGIARLRAADGSSRSTPRRSG